MDAAVRPPGVASRFPIGIWGASPTLKSPGGVRPEGHWPHSLGGVSGGIVGGGRTRPKGAPLLPAPTTFLERHGRLMGRLRWVVIPALDRAPGGRVMLGGRLGDVTTSEATLPGTEGQKGLELIQTHFSDGRMP